jgi:LPXTG-motif cell wall-anchored protein
MGITDYAKLEPGAYQVQVTPTGATEPIVIDANLDLATQTDYTVVAVGELANIEPLVLVDNNAAPAAGKAHVRFVHASPDAPAVDIAVANGGPVLFANVPFKGVGDYLPVDAGTYDLEARLAGTDTVALSVPGVALADGTVYTIFAMGLAGGEPALTAVPSVDATYDAPMPETMPATMPTTGGETTNMWLMAALGAGLVLIAGGLFVRFRAQKIEVR